MFTLPGSEIFQHNLAQNFDPVAPLLLVFFHSVWEKLWLLKASSHLWIEKGERGRKGARGDVMTVSCHFPWNPKDSLHVPREGVPAWPGQTVLQSGGAGRQKTPLASQYPRVKILPWLWIPLHQDGPWHGWAGAIQEATVGQASLGRTFSSTAATSSGGTTSPPLWGHCCYCSTQTHPPRGNHSPRSPWQMSVLVAPPTINLGSLTMSCNSETEKLLRISKEK